VNILDQIVTTKQMEIAAMKKAGQLSVFQSPGFQFKQPSFMDAIRHPRLSLIAEIKKASPSKGVIREDFHPLSLAKDLAKSAAALSVLTDQPYFMGDPMYIPLIRQEVMIPILRKEFIIDPIQIYQAKWLGASAILLIKAILDDQDALTLLTLAEDIGLDVLFEVHDESELEWALGQKKIRILGINSRNLRHFSIDPNALYTKLIHARKQRPDLILVAESGIQNISELTRLKEIGTNAVLIGEGLAKNPSILEGFKQS
jgi:indole-3-glycerol phosphate synthase